MSTPAAPLAPQPDLRALSEAVLAIAAETDLAGVLQMIVDRARELVGARYAALNIPEEGGVKTAQFLVSGLSPAEVEAIGPPPSGRGILGIILTQGVSVRVADVHRDGRFTGYPDGHPPIHSFLGVPIRQGEQVLGDLYFGEKMGSAGFAEADQELAELLAQHAALAMVNARLLARLAESERRYRLLTEGAPGIIFTLDPAGRISYVNDRLQAITGFKRKAVLGRLLSDIVQPADRPVVELHVRTMREGARHTRFMAHAPTARGVLHCYEISLVPSVGADAAFQGIALDVTERQALSREIAERTTELLSTQQERERLRELVALVIQAQEDERARIAGDLHDTTVQTLTAIGRRLHGLAADLPADGDGLAAELSTLATAALAEADEVHRLSRNLRPSVLDHLGLAAALQHLASDLEAHGIQVTLEVEGDATRLNDRARTALFRIAQEALTNVRRHSGASQAAVRLSLGGVEARLTVTDNGRGFAADEGAAAAGSRSARLGLAGMRERAAMLGGTLEVTSAPGGGTRVTARLPLDA